jgi:hypothetical protein
MAHLAKNCPRCGSPLNQERPALNALSRYDNATYICSPCGSDEAMFNFAHPDLDLPPLHLRLPLASLRLSQLDKDEPR